jgi:3-hydroxyisobutyrate dehydrogenase
MNKVGFIGLGKMGAPIALRLDNGKNSLFVYDCDGKTKLRTEKCKSIRFCNDVAEVARNVDILFTCLPNLKMLRSVLIGHNGDGAIFYLKRDSLCVDLSSSDPLGVVQLEKEIRKYKIQFVDAPVSGGIKGAKNGTLTIMVGGLESSFERAKPFLQIFGEKISHVGSVGSGQALKCLNNLCSATGLLITSECLLVAKKFGIDPEVFVEVINSSTGRNNSTENKLRQFMLSGTFDSGFSLSLMNKDLCSALTLAKEAKTNFSLGVANIGFWELAGKFLSKDSDHTEIIKWLENQ